MVTTWGGYIFVLNLIGLHALLLVLLGYYHAGVYRAYTLFFLVGTAGAVQIPVVGWTPLRSLEQIGPLLVFFGYQVCARFTRLVRTLRDGVGKRYPNFVGPRCQPYCYPTPGSS